MSAQLLSSELSNLIQESKRKHATLRSAAEKSLEDLKSLRASSEAQLAADLRQRPNFVTPFLIACETRNVKFTGIAIVCLQRLVVSRGLAKSRLKEVLEAFREAAPAGVDVQLKILQALPSLLQNYSEDIKDELLAATLTICFLLQSSKNAIVNNTAAATLQQLVVSVFDKVIVEDKKSLEIPTVGEAPAETGSVQLRSAALDAYRVFNDLCLLTEAQKPQFLRVSSLPQTFGLELIESVLTNHADIFLSHPEQGNILRIRVMPFILSSLSGRINFPTTVRIVRVLYTILRRHIEILVHECEMALGLLTHMLDPDTSFWKRTLCMEVFRGIFADAVLIRRIFALYDSLEGRKNVLRDLVATFVRISTEKPQVIGLGQQSSVPVVSQNSNDTGEAVLEVSGVPGIVSASSGSNEPSSGVSTQWSSMRVPCIDLLDKAESPSIPESYIYALTLTCINTFSEGLAKFILPLTVPSDGKKKRAARTSDSTGDGTSPALPDGSQDSTEGGKPTQVSDSRKTNERRGSKRRNPVPTNPLTLEDHPLINEVRICAAIIDECWPAILATCSTFLYAALDQDYYHGLVRAFQKFTHVAGLLRLPTPRDAFLTTLGKAAVPPNVLSANLSATPVPTTPTSENQSMFSNARGLLSVDSLVSHASTSERKGSSSDGSSPSLNTRNLLCLRALLNLGIALGPTLESAWLIILETLQQADFVLFSTRSSLNRGTAVAQRAENLVENSVLLVNIGNEIKAVETAAARLLESTIDFPNDSFVDIVDSLCKLFGRDDDSQQNEPPSTPKIPMTPLTPRRTSYSHRRLRSVNAAAQSQNQEDFFALSKLGDLSHINIDRLVSWSPEVSGWAIMTGELVSAASLISVPPPVRLRSTEVLVRIILEAAATTTALPDEERSAVQARLLAGLHQALVPLQDDKRVPSTSVHATDIDVHKIILEGLKSLLEQCGETLISGWDIVFRIIGSVFLHGNSDGDRSGQEVSKRASMTVSGRLIRSSFNSLQLICSDFLSALPNSCFITLVDTLYDFSSQDDDLNISLTTVTLFWVVSDFISNNPGCFSLREDRMMGKDVATLTKQASAENTEASNAALWMLLLLRLTAVTTDSRLELRNSAIQTLLRIFDAYGDRLDSDAWSLCLHSVIFELLTSIEVQLELHHTKGEGSEKEKSGWNDTTIVVLHGISSLLASYLGTLALHTGFADSWRSLLSHFKALLAFDDLEVNTAVFKALKEILSQANQQDSGAKAELDEASLSLAWELWSSGIPLSRHETKQNNQDCLLAYISALQELYRTIKDDLDAIRVQRMLTLLRETVKQASAANYSADVEYLTPLQGQIIDSIKMIRTDVNGVPAAIIAQVAELVALPFTDTQDTAEARTRAQKPTYVAFSKASMSLLEDLIVSHASEPEVYAGGALLTSLDALSQPIVIKYSFPIVTKSTAPWKLATTTALGVLKATLPLITNGSIPADALRLIWGAIVNIANGVMAADISPMQSTATREDEEFDIASFKTLKSLITPALGTQIVPDTTRRAYTESLFHKSFVHVADPTELPQMNQELLAVLYRPRKGKTLDPTVSHRAHMSYVCLDELVSLVSVHDSSPERVNLAQAAAPFLILRAGLTLRAYAADQPLRGLMPQPLPQRKELLYILRALVRLRCEPLSIPEAPGVESEGKKHLYRLYPLLIKAVRAAAKDQEVLECLSKALDEVGMEFGV